MSSAELWIVASTLIFVVLVYKPAKNALTGGLDARAATIVKELNEARRLREEAEALLAQAKAKHHTAGADAEAIVAFARDEAVRMRSHAEAELKTHLARREKQALDRIAQAETAAIADVRARAVDIAITASAHLLTQKLAGAEGDKLVDGAIVALPQQLGTSTTTQPQVSDAA